MDTDQSAATIRQIVAEAGEITGSKLALALRSLAPDWDAHAFGNSSLREFVEQHVSDIVVAGRSGMDLVYKLQAGLAEPKSQTKQLWTTWVSPYGPYTLLVDRQTGQVEQLPRAATPPKHLQRLVLPSEADHLALAQAFLGAWPQLQPQLGRILAAPKRQWWRQWYAEVSKAGHLDAWKAFRQAKLEDLLRSELRSAIGDHALAAHAFSSIAETKPVSSGQSTAAEPQIDAANATKKAIIEAIEQMNTEQVRSLHEALEIVFHALHQRFK